LTCPSSFAGKRVVALLASTRASHSCGSGFSRPRRLTRPETSRLPLYSTTPAAASACARESCSGSRPLSSARSSRVGRAVVAFPRQRRYAFATTVNAQPLHGQYATYPRGPLATRRAPNSALRAHGIPLPCRYTARHSLVCSLGNKSGNKPMSKAESQQQGFLGDKSRPKWPLSCGFVLRRALRNPQIVARFQARKRDTQASDLRKRGAPKGIRIPVASATECRSAMTSSVGGASHRQRRPHIWRFRSSEACGFVLTSAKRAPHPNPAATRVATFGPEDEVEGRSRFSRNTTLYLLIPNGGRCRI
jgi:hypothetical protein